jgi:zinc and cadmium transporter
MPTTVLIVYCLAALVASLVGGALPSWVRLTHTRQQTALSFVAGLMLGMALLHLIPHASHATGSLDRTVQWALVGFLTMFFLQRLFHYHQHGLPEPGLERCSCHAPDHGHDDANSAPGKLTWIGTTIGLGLHSIFDGLAVAAAVAAESGGAGLVGFGAAMAVILHKPFDAMAVTTLMHASRTSRGARRWVNLGFASITPLGVALFALGVGGLAEANETVVGCALAFCGGTFLCIACSDLLPELHFHTHDRLKLSAALAAGLAIAILVGQFESCGHDHHEGCAHDHDHGHAHEAVEVPAEMR